MHEVSVTKTILKSAGPRLVPFLKTCAVFFILFPEKLSGNLWYLLFKCAPIVCLVGFVLSEGLSLSAAYGYNRRIAAGLLFSMLGDTALVFDSQFLTGIFFFACAQLCYTLAFGMSPLRLGLGAAFGLLATCLYACVAPLVQSAVVQCAGFVYTALIFAMLWRAAARVKVTSSSVTSWTSLCSLVGAVLFVVSDLSLVVNKFVVPLPRAHQVVMVTYYAAQLGIALSVVDSHVDTVVRMSAEAT